jgi:hypothetical protein
MQVESCAFMVRRGVSNYRKLDLFLEPPVDKVLFLL